MARSYLSLRVVENSEQARMWNLLLAELERRTIRVTTPLLLQEGISGGSMLSIVRQRPGSVGAETFVVNNGTAPLTVAVRGGTIIWHDKDFIVPDSGDIPVPASSGDFKVWLTLEPDEFSPVGQGPPGFGFTGFDFGPSGWVGYPAQPDPPARKYLLLAEINSDVTSITEINPRWHGGDIVWPTIFGFHI